MQTQPTGPTSTAGRVARLEPTHAGEILTVQRAAFVTEAQAHDNVWLPPLTETLDELRAALARPSVLAWGGWENHRLVACIRVEIVGDSAKLGRLAVAPDRQGQGWGTGLMNYAERRLPARVTVIELFTGEHSTGNLRLYRRLGYQETHRSAAGNHETVHLSKRRVAPVGDPTSVRAAAKPGPATG
jgi:ribosomal protein S18 acetylase RimI-like enzyme